MKKIHYAAMLGLFLMAAVGCQKETAQTGLEPGVTSARLAKMFQEAGNKLSSFYNSPVVEAPPQGGTTQLGIPELSEAEAYAIVEPLMQLSTQYFLQHYNIDLGLYFPANDPRRALAGKMILRLEQIADFGNTVDAGWFAEGAMIESDLLDCVLQTLGIPAGVEPVSSSLNNLSDPRVRNRVARKMLQVLANQASGIGVVASILASVSECMETSAPTD